jgi:hypothetical protein
MEYVERAVVSWFGETFGFAVVLNSAGEKTREKVYVGYHDGHFTSLDENDYPNFGEKKKVRDGYTITLIHPQIRDEIVFRRQQVKEKSKRDKALPWAFSTDQWEKAFQPSERRRPQQEPSRRGRFLRDCQPSVRS